MMKKIVLVLGLFLTALFAGNFYVGAQSSLANVSWTATNVSKDNSNAVLNGARPGDVVRYEVMLTGGDGPGNYNPRVDVSDIVGKTDMVNLGGGVMEGDDLVFPPKLCAGCEEQRFSFFVRVNDVCENASSMMISLNGSMVTVPFECQLSQTGPNLFLILSVGLMLTIMGYFILSLKREKIN